MTRHRLLALAVVLVLTACASFTQQTQKLSLGMSTAQVKDILGGNYTVLASRYGQDGRPSEFWQFRNPDSGQLFSIYFKDDKLVQWGSPDALKNMWELNGADTGARTLPQNIPQATIPQQNGKN
ncbi:MAG: hypothetical protein PW734_12665 [Verrucomicrobium sp.]|nr:hypothetical protein [Verrucomicrobium sp.]